MFILDFFGDAKLLAVFNLFNSFENLSSLINYSLLQSM